MDKIAETLKEAGTVVVDVRSPAEYMGGHVAGSINIPVNEIPGRIAEFKQMKNILLCCASGIRSATAYMFLKQNNIECIDGGTWLVVNNYVNNN